jgi:hypothetical protein
MTLRVKICRKGSLVTFFLITGGLGATRVGDVRGVSCNSTSEENELYGESSVATRI